MSSNNNERVIYSYLNETYSLQLYKYFNDNTKFKDISLTKCIFVILKDQCNNINNDISTSSIFSIEKKNIYVTSKVIKEDYKDNNNIIQSINNKFKEITINANNKYNKWIELKNDEEVLKWKPLFLKLWSIYIKPFEVEMYTSNGTCLSQCYSEYVVFPIYLIIVILAYLFLYPSMYFYDYISGRSSKLNDIIQAKIKDDGYQYTDEIDLYISEELKNLTTEYKINNINIESGTYMYKYVVRDTGVDGDSFSDHLADQFLLRFVQSNDSNVIITVNDDDNNININNNDSNNHYKGLPTEDV